MVSFCQGNIERQLGSPLWWTKGIYVDLQPMWGVWDCGELTGSGTFENHLTLWETGLTSGAGLEMPSDSSTCRHCTTSLYVELPSKAIWRWVRLGQESSSLGYRVQACHSVMWPCLNSLTSLTVWPQFLGSIAECCVQSFQSCLSLWGPMDHCPWIFQPRILEWLAMPSSRASSLPRVQPTSPAFQADFLLLSYWESPQVIKMLSPLDDPGHALQGLKSWYACFILLVNMPILENYKVFMFRYNYFNEAALNFLY